jgi:hypothetical protein
MSKSYTVPVHVAARYPYTLPPTPSRGPHPVDHSGKTPIVITSGSYHFPGSIRQARRATRARRSQ